MKWRELVLRIFRVPAEPAPPPGSSPRVFRAAPNYFMLRALRYAAGQLVAIGGLVFATMFVSAVSDEAPRAVAWLLRAGEIFAWVAFIPQALFAWGVTRLDYELRWYLVSDRAIRIREGITTVREKTIALANIQNIAVRQGPLQRWLGIADVEVKTAGGGAEMSEGKKKPGEPMHVGYFRGVDNAEEIRDLLREGVRRQRDTGLGDPDEEQEQDDAADGDAADAARELLAEARALRAAVRGADRS